MEQADKEEKLPGPIGLHDHCDSNPDFAVICSFINKFGAKIDLKLDIEELKSSLEDTENLHDNLIDIHVKLLKKVRRYFVRNKWEKALMKFAYEHSYEDGQEIKTIGYLKTRTSTKLSLLHRLLEAQFECDPKLKTAVNLIEASELNTKPTGRDIEGNTYWTCVDEHGNLRVFREEPLQDNSLTTICKNSDDLKQLIEHLEATKDDKIKGEPYPDPDVSNSSSSSSPSESNEDESFTKAFGEAKKHQDGDGEFACEDEETNDEPVIVKRARTARQTLELDETCDPNYSSITGEDKPCERCDKSNDPERILLCDMCDDGYHTLCCVPPLMYVPDGDWFCPSCEQKMLTEKLKELCKSVVDLLAKKERERQKKQKLRQPAPKKNNTKIKIDEIIASSEESFQASSDDIEDDEYVNEDEDEYEDDEYVNEDEDEYEDEDEDEDELEEELEDELEDELENEATEVSTEEDSSIDEIVSMYRSKWKGRKSKKLKKRERHSDDSEDSDFEPRTRRAAAQKVSYRETTDEEEIEEEDPLVNNVEPAPMTRDPISELSQYCSQSSYPSDPLFRSFKMSPPHHQFYNEDEVRSLPNDLNE